MGHLEPEDVPAWIKEVEVLRLRPGDVLAVHEDPDPGVEIDIDGLATALRAVLPAGVEPILSYGLRFQVLRTHQDGDGI